MRLWNRLARAPLPLPLRWPAVGATAWPGILLGLALGLTVQGARADDGEPAETAEMPETAELEPAWIPSLSVGFDTFAYSAKVETVDLVPDSAAAGGSGSASDVQLRLQFGGQLESPKLDWLPGRPRLFAEGGVGLPPFASDRLFGTGVLQQPPEVDIQTKVLVVRNQEFTLQDAEGTAITGTGPSIDNFPQNPRPPGNDVSDCFEQPDLPTGAKGWTCATGQFSDSSDGNTYIRGNGSQVNVKLGDVSWYAGLGIGFDIPIGESLLLQLKPSIAYQGEPVKLSGQLVTTTIDEIPVSFTCRPNKNCPFGTDFATQQFAVWRGPSSSDLVDHHLGLGLELDLGLSRSSWPVRASLFVDTRLLWLVSDPTTTFSNPVGERNLLGPRAVDSVTTPTDFPVASYRVTRDEFEVRGGAGVRFSWVGFAR